MSRTSTRFKPGDAERLRIDAVLQHDVLEPVVVLIEVVRSEDRERLCPTCASASSTPSLPPKCGSHAARSGVLDRDIDDFLDVLLAQRAHRQQPLVHLGRADGVDEEHAVDALEYALDALDLASRRSRP